MFSLICAWINDRINNGEAGDLRHHRAHYNIVVMQIGILNLQPTREILSFEVILSKALELIYGAYFRFPKSWCRQLFNWLSYCYWSRDLAHSMRWLLFSNLGLILILWIKHSSYKDSFFVWECIRVHDNKTVDNRMKPGDIGNWYYPIMKFVLRSEASDYWILYEWKKKITHSQSKRVLVPELLTYIHEVRLPNHLHDTNNTNRSNLNYLNTIWALFFLTWINCIPSMDKWSHARISMGWNYLSIPKPQRCKFGNE